MNAAGKAEMLIENAASARSDNEAVADCTGEDESVTLTVKFDVAAAVAVPIIAPVEAFRLSPAGNEPEVTVHVYGVLPPFACNAPE